MLTNQREHADFSPAQQLFTVQVVLALGTAPVRSQSLILTKHKQYFMPRASVVYAFSLFRDGSENKVHPETDNTVNFW